MIIVNRKSPILNYRGFTLIEMIIVVAIMGILATLAYSTLRTPKERIACKNIFSALHMVKMRAIATGYNAYIDFDMNGGNVSDNFYTVYLDTDDDGVFGEINNANSENEFSKSHFAMQDSLGIYTGVALPGGVQFGFSDVNPPTRDPRGQVIASSSPSVLIDGVAFGSGNRVRFNPKGTGGPAGSVYLYDETDSSSGKSCMVRVHSTGIIRMSNWDGEKWSHTW